MADKKLIDRERLAVEYRAGVRSLRELGSEFGISAARVAQIAKAEGWERDLSAKIKHEAQARLNKAALDEGLNESRRATEKEVVEANAAMQTSVILSHREDLKKLRDRANKYEAELNDCTDELGKRVSILRQLADTQKSIIGLERQAFGIDADKNNSNGSSIEDVLAEIRAKESVA